MVMIAAQLYPTLALTRKQVPTTTKNSNKSTGSTSTSTTYNLVNSVRLENVPVSSFWILLLLRYLRNERTKELSGQKR